MNERLETLVESCAATLGLDLEDLELSPAGKRRVLRIAVDKDDGVNIDDIADATRAISAELDATDVMGALPYTLEVTSRGVDRPLVLQRHWRRNADRLVRVVLDDDSVVEGRIGLSSESGVDIVTRAHTQHLSYDSIASALVQTELNRKDR